MPYLSVVKNGRVFDFDQIWHSRLIVPPWNLGCPLPVMAHRDIWLHREDRSLLGESGHDSVRALRIGSDLSRVTRLTIRLVYTSEHTPLAVRS
jgi:hypothetical protein